MPMYITVASMNNEMGKQFFAIIRVQCEGLQIAGTAVQAFFKLNTIVNVEPTFLNNFFITLYHYLYV